MTVVGVSAACVSVGGWINRRGFRLDVMMRGTKQWRTSSPPTPAVSTVNIWKWETDSGAFIHPLYERIYTRCSDSYGFTKHPGSRGGVTDSGALKIASFSLIVAKYIIINHPSHLSSLTLPSDQRPNLAALKMKTSCQFGGSELC